MKYHIWIVTALIFMALCIPNAYAGSCPKAELEKAVDYAVNLVNTKGKAAVPELEKYRYCNGEGYVFMTDMNGISIMHPILHNTGADTLKLQGAKGEYFGMEMKVKVEKYGKGWVSYYWQNPKTKNLEIKCTFVKGAAMDGKKIFIGTGMYGISAGDCQ